MIGSFVVAFDCGSTSSAGMVERCIDHLRDDIDTIDILFISHFDRDHVNGIRYLLNHIRVRKVVTAFIPADLKLVYGVYTSGAYTAIMDMLMGNDLDVNEIGSEDMDSRSFSFQSKWEWIAKSMMHTAEFEIIKSLLVTGGFDANRLQDAEYVETKKEIINSAFKHVFGAKGPNAKGLVMLSQPCKGTATLGSDVLRGFRHRFCFMQINHRDESSCLYVGDADLKNISNKKDVKDFLQRNRTEATLLFMQLPHHGSQNSIGVNFDKGFPAQYYILNDVNTNRLQKTPRFFDAISRQGQLLVCRAYCCDAVRNETEL